MANSSSLYTVEASDLKLRAEVCEEGVCLDGADSTVILNDGRRLRQFDGTRDDGSVVPIYVGDGDGDHEYVVYINGETIPVRLVTQRDERLLALRKNTRSGASSGMMVTAPMPGLLKSIVVAVGDVVEKGAALCILEAMKMENEIKSPARMIVRQLIAAEGVAVEKGSPLVELAPVESAG